MRDKVVLITGGTGSFGTAFLKEVLTKDPKQVRIYSRDELKQAQLKAEINDLRVEYLLGDVRDYERLLVALEGVDICIHAAAMKRIEKCERDPGEAIKTNVQGTMNVAMACLKNNVKTAILISTDKAVYPINLYGATKLCAEKVWIQSNVYRGGSHPTKFSVVRYGNVLGSRGSVISLFRNQASSGTLQVTDQRMTRFFVTLQGAVELVQVAIELSQGGEIFVPRLKAASIYNLAVLMSENKLPVEITNPRGGEKAHESLITKEESERMASEGPYNVINPESVNLTWAYQLWTSKNRNWVENSSQAEQFTDDELKAILATT